MEKICQQQGEVLNGELISSSILLGVFLEECYQNSATE